MQATEKAHIIKNECTWNNTYQNLYERAKNIIKKNETMAVYHTKEHLSIETDAFGVSSIYEQEPNYFFAHEVSMITDHKLLVAVYKKEVMCLSHRLKNILSCIHQHSIRILYTPGPQLFIADWLSRHNLRQIEVRK